MVIYILGWGSTTLPHLHKNETDLTVSLLPVYEGTGHVLKYPESCMVSQNGLSKNKFPNTRILITSQMHKNIKIKNHNISGKGMHVKGTNNIQYECKLKDNTE